jgi:hypothetical protein
LYLRDVHVMQEIARAGRGLLGYFRQPVQHSVRVERKDARHRSNSEPFG